MEDETSPLDSPSDSLLATSVGHCHPLSNYLAYKPAI